MIAPTAQADAPAREVPTRGVDRVLRGDARRIAALAGITAAIRLAIDAVLPARVLSEDFHIWDMVTGVLLRGENPYAVSRLLFYPPLWMQVLFVLGKISNRTHVSLAHLIQVVLTGIDVVIVILAYLFMRALGVGPRAFWFVLVGIALNPISILLACEHGNFDALVGLLVLATAFALVAWSRGAASSMWLIACLTLGLGILAKTVPLIVAPLLFIRWRETDWATRVVGVALVVGPTLVGVSVLYVLSPQDVVADIFQYRSAAGWFGVSGLVNILGGAQAVRGYSSVYPLIALAVVTAATVAVARRRALSDLTIVLAAALLLMWIPPLGSGYGPQYTGWFLPIAVVLFAIAPGKLRASLAVFAVVALLTYLVEYAFIPTQGAFLSLVAPHTTASIGSRLSSPTAATLLRLPLFFAYLGFLTIGVLMLLQSSRVKGAVLVKSGG